MADGISILYQRAKSAGLLKQGLTEDMFREQTKTDQGLKSFYDYAKLQGTPLSDWNTFRSRARAGAQTTTAKPAAPQQTRTAQTTQSTMRPAQPHVMSEAEYKAQMDKEIAAHDAKMREVYSNPDAYNQQNSKGFSSAFVPNKSSSPVKSAQSTNPTSISTSQLPANVQARIGEMTPEGAKKREETTSNQEGFRTVGEYDPNAKPILAPDRADGQRDVFLMGDFTDDERKQYEERERLRAENMPRYQQMWAEDEKVFDNIVKQAEIEGLQAVDSVGKEQMKSQWYKPDGGLLTLFKVNKAYNEHTDPDVIASKTINYIANRYEKEQEVATKKQMREEIKKNKDYAHLTEDEITELINEEYAKLKGMSVEQLAEKAGIDNSDLSIYAEYVQEQMQNKFVDIYTPKDNWEYFARKVAEGNLIAMVASLAFDTPAQRAYKMRGTQRYASQNEGAGITAINLAAEGANIVTDPTMYFFPGAGNMISHTGARWIGSQVLKRKGIPFATRVAERQLMQRGSWGAATRLFGGALGFAGIDVSHNIVGQLYTPVYNEETGKFENGTIDPMEVLGAAGKGATMGVAFGTAGLFGDAVQRNVSKAYGNTLGAIVGKSTHYASGTTLLFGSDVLSQMAQGVNVDDIDFGEAYRHAALTQLFFDVWGGVKQFDANRNIRLKDGSVQHMPFRDAVRLTWNNIKNPFQEQFTFTDEELEQLSKYVKGGNNQEILLNLGSKGKQGNDNWLGDFYKQLNNIFSDPEVDTQTKYKLSFLLDGEGKWNIRPIIVGDVENIGQGRYEVRTLDSSGSTYATRRFNSAREAEIYKAEQQEAIMKDKMEWLQGVAATYGFAKVFNGFIEEDIAKTIENYKSTKPLTEADARRILFTPKNELGKAELAIRERMEDYLAKEVRGEDYIAYLRKAFAHEMGISKEDVDRLLLMDYSALTNKQRGIFDAYVRRLEEHIPLSKEIREQRAALPQGGGEAVTYTEPNTPDAGMPEQAELVSEQPSEPESPASSERRRITEEVMQFADGNTHPSGYMYKVSIQGDESKVGYVVEGDVAELEKVGDKFVFANDNVLTIRWEDGTVGQVSSKDLDLQDTLSREGYIQGEVERRMNEYTAGRIDGGDNPIIMQDANGNVQGFFQTEKEGVVEDENGNVFSIDQLADEGWQEVVMDDNGMAILTPLRRAPRTQSDVTPDDGGTPTPPPAEPVPVIDRSRTEEKPSMQVTPSEAPTTPDIDAMSADEYGASMVEFMGDKSSAVAFLEAERDKADAELSRLSKQKITRYRDMFDFREQQLELQKARTEATNRFNKLQNAILAASSYKTPEEIAAEETRKAAAEARRQARRQTQAAQLSNAAPAEKWNSAAKTNGNAVTRTLTDGTVIKGHYVLVEAGAATPSHDPFNNWNTSNGFPTTEDGRNINDRDYKNDTDAQQITMQIAQTYDGQAVEQVPVVSSEGIVYDGNGRTIAGNIAAANNTDAAYIDALKANAQNFGFTPEQVASMKHPRVYLQTDEDMPYSTTTFSKFNAQEKKTQSSTNRAISHSKKLTDAARDNMLEIIDNYGNLDTFFSSEKGASDIMRTLLDTGIISQQEVAGLTEKTDRGYILSPTGRDAITDMLLGAVFNEDTIRMLGNDKGLKQSILRAMPSIVENRRLGEYALTDHIGNAIQLLYEARLQKLTYQQYLLQGNAFEGYVKDRFSAEAMLMAEEMSSGVDAFRNVLDLYNNSARDEANGQMSIDGQRTRDDITNEILQHYGKETKQPAAVEPAGQQTEPVVPSTPASTEPEQSLTEQQVNAIEEAFALYDTGADDNVYHLLSTIRDIAAGNKEITGHVDEIQSGLDEEGLGDIDIRDEAAEELRSRMQDIILRERGANSAKIAENAEKTSEKGENILPNEKNVVFLQENQKEYTADGLSVVVSTDDYTTYMTPEAREVFKRRAIARARNTGREYAHPEIAFIKQAVWDGVVIPVEELERIPEIVDAEERIKKIRDEKGSLEISEADVERLANRLLDAEHGSAVLNEEGKIIKHNGVEDFSGEVKQERKAFIVIGRPAAGKSSVFANPLSYEHSARIIDSDVVKPWLDGFDEGFGAGYVQAASDAIMQKALWKAVENGDNIVIPKIGGASIIEKVVNPLRNAGYSVELYYNEVKPESSYMRAMARFAEEGRFLSLEYLKSIKDKAHKTFNRYANLTSEEYEQINKTAGLGEGNALPSIPTVSELLERQRGGEASVQNARRGREELSSVAGERQGELESRRGESDVPERLFDYAEWKNNDVPIGEKPKLIWNSERVVKPQPVETPQAESKFKEGDKIVYKGKHNGVITGVNNDGTYNFEYPNALGINVQAIGISADELQSIEKPHPYNMQDWLADGDFKAKKGQQVTDDVVEFFRDEEKTIYDKDGKLQIEDTNDPEADVFRTFEKGKDGGWKYVGKQPKIEENVNPRLANFRKLKEKYPNHILLFRTGDFYEMYEEDAEEGSKILGITLAKNGQTQLGLVKLAGFPFHALDTYLPKLVRAGKKVAICDSLDDESLSKKLIKRPETEIHEQEIIAQANEEAPLYNTEKYGEETTDKESADSVAIKDEAESVIAEAASIGEPEQLDRPAERDGGSEVVEGVSGERGDVELTPEERDDYATLALGTIDKIDASLDKVNEQLAILGYYEADEADNDFHEFYGYMKSAEKKALKDIERLAKQLAGDLDIEINKRKKLASANIAPAGGDITFRLPLPDGLELYFCISLEPNYNGYYRADGKQDDLAASNLFWRVEDPQASGMKRFLTGNHNIGTWRSRIIDVTYSDVLRDLKMLAKDYLPKVKVGTTRADVSKKAIEKAARKKADKTRIPDGQQVLDLFSDVVEDINEAVAAEVKPVAQIVETPKSTDNGSTEVRNDGQRESSAPQAEPAGQPENEDGALGGSKQPTDERPIRRGVDKSGQQHRVHDGERSGGTVAQSAAQDVAELPQSEWKNIHNFRARRGEALAPTTNKARYDANMAAIRLLKQLQDEGRQATREEQDILAQYSGWGGLGEYFKGEPGTTYWSSHGEKSPYQTLKELLTDEELQAAQMSRNSAYYTPAPVIDTLWDIASRLGFRGGNILEGSAGIGNILALMPSDISHRSDIQAVEIDDITAGILEQLYPDAKTYHSGFEKVDIPNNSIDLAITNVPFVTGLSVFDPQEKDLSKRFKNIHDFCIAKNVRKLRQGGLGIFISSSGTLDNSKDLRRWLNAEGDADVIGAFRLNNETFGGTSATSDIIVVRKRVNGEKDPRAIDVLDTKVARIALQPQEEVWNRKTMSYDTPDPKEIKLVYNQYYVDHPESMGGVMGFGFEHGDTRWGGTTAGCYVDASVDQDNAIRNWVANIEKGEMQTIVEPKATGNYEKYDGNAPYGSLILNSKGEICRVSHGEAVPVDGINPQKVKGHSKAEVLKDYNTLKNAVDEALAAQTKDIREAELKPYLKALNYAYDGFVRKYGRLNGNTSLSFLRNDVQWASMAALENVKETLDANGKKKIDVTKTDVFSKRVVGVQPEPKADNAKDGIILSVQQFGNIRPDKIAEWLGKSADEVEREIIDSRLGFRDPQTGNIQVRHEYLSGNVREKLAYAEEHNTDGQFDTNIEELRKAMPIDIPAHLIEFNVGSTWIPTELYQDYLKEKFDVSDLRLTHVGSSWVSDEQSGSYGKWSLQNEKNRSEGVYSELIGKQVYGHELMLAAMNNVPIVVSETKKNYDGTTTTTTDKQATAACSDKISQIKDDFVEWARGKMQQDEELAERVQKIYNERFNSIVPMLGVDDMFLSPHLPGQNHKYTLYDHQQQAVVRATTQPVMLAHEVGTGKTITLISAAMEMRRLGTAKKPMIVVQNATTAQFVKEAKDLYPNAKILTVSERDRTKEGRQEFYAKIKYNDWDLIIVPQSVFDMIPDSEARMRDFIEEKIEEKIHAIEAAKEAGVDSKVTKRMERELDMLREDLDTNNMSGKRTSKKAKEKDAKKEAEQRANAAARAEAMLDRRTDEVADFDDMGIDALLIDEAHNYKHLGFATMMTRGVKGVDPSYSKRAAALYLKCQSVYERQGHKNVVFATGTPISNTAAEIWTFMKYLMPKDVLKENDIYYFDDFVHNFGKINEQLEFATNGKFKANNRFAQYGNVPELMRLWLTCADCVLTREVGQVNDKVPEIEDGKAKDIFLPQSPSLIDIMAAVRAKLDEYEHMSGKEKKENSHIPLTMYGIAKRAAIDPRLVSANAADEPLSKTNKAVEETLRSLDDSKKYNGTVAIFCDSYQNKQTGFNLFNEIKNKLVQNGVPEKKIAIIRSEMTDNAKQKIFDAVREGEIRVIMGSTQTLGTGVNIQTRLHTLIHMDAPDRPMDYTQRNGRIIRQGNMHKQWGIPVRVLRFGVEDSLDVTSYQRLKTKAGFIDSIMNGKSLIDNNLENRVIEDVEEGIFDNPVAMLSGSQYALLKSQAERDLRKWKARKEQHKIDQILISSRLRSNEANTKREEQNIKMYNNRLDILGQMVPDGKVTEYNIDGHVARTPEQLKEAIKVVNKDIQDQAETLRRNNAYGQPDTKVVITPISFNGLQFNIATRLVRKSTWKDGNHVVSVDKSVTFSSDALSMSDIQSRFVGIDNVLDFIEKQILSGNSSRDNIKFSQDHIARMAQESELMKQREGKPFLHQEDFDKAQALVDEYTEKMKAEMAEKEAKYAQQSAKSVDLDNMDAEDDTTEETELQYGEVDYDSENLTPAQQLATDALIEALSQNSSIEYKVATEEDVAEMLRNEQKRKSLDETATWRELMLHTNKAADISSNDGAKVLKNIETTKLKLEKTSNRNIKDQIGVISNAIGLQKTGNSYYGSFKTGGGNIVTLRISNHNATVSNFDREGELEGISIVISNMPSNGIINDGTAHVVEFFYRKADILKAYGAPLADILESVKVLLETGEYIDKTGLAEPEEVNAPEEMIVPEMSIVADKKTSDRLDSEPTIKVYRAMQVIDGKLYPPMAAKQNGQLVQPIELGKWEQAEEHPELIDKDGKFKLNKANGSSPVPAAYNPYFHTSRSPLNDQFTSAYDRPNLVTVEVEVPASELTSGYKADKAKDAVGETTWHSGAVSGKLAALGNPRRVILSRWDKPIRIVPDSEVAGRIADMLKGTNIAIPYNTVTPSLLRELKKAGVEISNTPSGTIKRAEEMRTSDGTLYGWAVGNKVYLTPKGLNPNSPVHEYSHLWIKAIKDNNPELYKNLQDLFSRENLPDMYEELDYDTNYSKLSEEGKMSEVFARFSSKRGARNMESEARRMIEEAAQSGSKAKIAKTASLIQRMKALLKKAWDWIGEHLFNIKAFGSREEAADRALYDLLNGTRLNKSDVFYSNAENAVEQIGQEKATPEQWLAMISKNGGLKAGEDKWLGLSDWLKEQKGTLTKKQVLDYIRANKIQLEEVHYSENEYDAYPTYRALSKEFDNLMAQENATMMAERASNAFEKMADKYGETFRSVFKQDYSYEREKWIISPEVDYYGNLTEESKKYFGERDKDAPRPIHKVRKRFTTYGLKNKREIALVVPNIESWQSGDNIHFGDAGPGKTVAWVRFGDAYAPVDGGAKEAEFRAIMEDNDKWYKEHPTFARYGVGDDALKKESEERKERQRAAHQESSKVPNSVKVLVIDEIQSNRHQEGREKGYRDVQADKAFNDFVEKMTAKYNKPAYSLTAIMTEEEMAEFNRLNDLRNESAIPAAPFERNWHELAMKRILRFAAENGYDKVAWTTGEQQAKRYDLGKVIERIDVTPWFTDEATGQEVRVATVHPNNASEMLYRFDRDGNIVSVDGLEGGDEDAQTLADIVGKDMEKTLISTDQRVIKGDGLRVGYDGMKGFYDDMLPRFMQKYGKKWGAVVSDVPVKLGTITTTFHSVDITPEMRESVVMQGQPMFSYEPKHEYLNRSEQVTRSLVQMAKDNYAITQQALRKINADLKAIQAATRMQADLDRNTVAALLNLVNTLTRSGGIWSQYMPNTTAMIATQIRNAIGREDITPQVDKIMDYIVDAQKQVAKSQWNKLLATKVEKINISGVATQGKVAVQGQHALKALNDALYNHMTIEQLQDQIAELDYQAQNATDESLRSQYDGKRIGYMMAADYIERVETLMQERQQLNEQLDAARADKSLKRDARQELIDSLHRSLRDNNLEQAEAYRQAASNLQAYIEEQHAAAKAFVERQDANREKIRNYAARDLAGLATNPNRLRTKQSIARNMLDAFASPIRDLQSLLRLCGLHAPDGEGYLYNHFMRGWTDAADMERTGIVNAQKTLDDKVSELTNGKYKTWEETSIKLQNASRKMFTLTMFNGEDESGRPIMEEIPLNANNALYIYAVNKMEDGKMKLRAMNISEEDVQSLADKVREEFGQEILDVVDWIQSDFFSRLRNRYNPTHEALFGAPMDAIENYFPLVINPNSRQKNEDLGDTDTDAARLLTGTSTGAIKRRTKNQLPLDVRNADFFQQVIRHISQMERWNAFAQWNRDANILFSDINFRNRVKGMNTIYGTGDALYNYMKDAFKVAMGTYRPQTDKISAFTLNAAKGVTSAKINFRVFTALKQLASFPAFFTYMQDGVFVSSYLRNWLTPHSTMKWAKENLPNFEKRVSKRDLGDMRLMQRSTDWQWNKRVLEWSQKYGMAANVYFDTLTCATGARAVYDSRYAEYIKKGFSMEQAEQRARQDAEQSFNTSQQSSEGAYMSPIQQDRNIITAALTVFRTSPIQYTRNFIYHTRNLMRKFGEGKRDEQIKFRAEQYRNDGLNDEQAQAAAEHDFNKSIRADIVGFVVYGALLNILWRLAGQVPYLLFGNDDDKKKEILKDATTGGALVSPLTGLLGGGMVENAIDGYGSVSQVFSPELPMTQDMKRAEEYLGHDKYAEFTSQALSVLMQSSTGFDPQTASDMISRIVTTLESEQDLETAKQAIRISQALLSIPQSQYEQMLVDGIQKKTKGYSEALADYERYRAVHTAPLTWWMRDEEAEKKAQESAKRRFDKLIKERDNLKQ